MWFVSLHFSLSLMLSQTFHDCLSLVLSSSVSLSTSVFWQGCISSLAVLLGGGGGSGGVGDSQGTSEYINSHQKANRAEAEWRLGALSCEWHWAAVWVYHHSITARMSSGITHAGAHTHKTCRHMCIHAPTAHKQFCKHTDTNRHTHTGTRMHSNAPAACHWQVKCNQSLSLFLLSFLTPLLLSALVSGFHAASCSIDPDLALIACPLKWNYLDIDIVEYSAISSGCNWWRTALTELI